MKKVMALENGGFLLQVINDKTGAVSDALTFDAEPVFDQEHLSKVLRDTVNKHGERRRAALTFIGMVLQEKCMSGWRGAGDKTKGSPSKEMKQSFRDAITVTVKRLAVPLKLTKENDVDEAKVQSFISKLNEDKNLEAVKTVALKYWVFCGESCVTKSGHTVPMPVMQARISDVLEIPASDTSLCGQIVALQQLVNSRNEKTKIEGGTYGLINAVVALRDMLSVFEGLQRQADELATGQRVHTPSPDANAAMNATLAKASVKPAAAPAPATV